jgi:hypothetical protein
MVQGSPVGKSSSQGFGRGVTDGRMSTPAVVVSDVGRDFLSGDVAILVRFHVELGLDGSMP